MYWMKRQIQPFNVILEFMIAHLVYHEFIIRILFEQSRSIHVRITQQMDPHRLRCVFPCFGNRAENCLFVFCVGG